MGSKQEKLVQLTNQGASLYQSGRIKEAEECYRQAIEIDKKESIAWGMLGLVLSAQGRQEESLKAFQQCFKLDKTPNQGILLNYASLLKALGRIDEAEKVLLQLLRDYPQFSMAWYNLGNLYLQKRDWKQAIQKYEVALNHSPDTVTTVKILWNQGVALKELGELDPAEKSLLDALEIDPSNTGVESVLQEVRSIKKERMMKEMEQEINLRSIQVGGVGMPDEAVNYAMQLYRERQEKLETGYRLLRQGNFDEALNVAIELSRREGERAEVQMLLATVYNAKGEFSLALGELDRILKNYPKTAAAWVRKGEALAGLGKMQEAEEAMQKALETQPNDEQVRTYVDNWRKSRS